MSHQVTSDHRGASILVAQLAASGLREAVISPGSRNAPLTIAFDAHPQIRTHVVIDERAAAYYALGLGLKTGVPAAVVCTSGTASLNHAPAIAEAFHHKTPLISITADRPTSVIERGHGQSIFQAGVFGKNVGHSVVIDECEMSNSTIIVETKKAFDIALTGTSAHINVPFEEPLYGVMPVEEWNLIAGSKSEKVCSGTVDFPEELLKPDLKVLILAGSLPQYVQGNGAVIYLPGICERWSGITGDAVMHSADLLMGRNNGELPEELEPDVVITVGTPTLSKALRNHFLKTKPLHFHLSDSGKGWDIWDELSLTINYNPIDALLQFQEVGSFNSEYIKAWKKLEKTADLTDSPWSDALVFQTVFDSVNSSVNIHLSNSTSARYPQLIRAKDGLNFHCNRGVAGIDGCTSTAVGYAMNSDSDVLLITGDIAFLYDLNGLASVDALPKNLKVVVINNGGGEIFRWLNGPEKTDLVDKYFETKPRTIVKDAAKYCGLTYFCATNKDETQRGVEELFKGGSGPAILEVITDGLKSTEVYKKILSR
tara:strand:- start:7205 stop:8827 length:1623 start_codon:yes stop_codon:yes gene_type:complete